MTVFVPGVAQVKFRGTVTGAPFAVITHWRFGTATAAWSATDLSTLANTWFNSLKTRLQASFSTSVTATGVDTVDLSNATPNTGTSTGAAWSGTGTAQWGPQMCWLVQMHIAARYRGGHPRMYMPTGSATMTTNGADVNTSFINIVQPAIVGCVGDVVTALPGSGSGAANNCVPLFAYTYTSDPAKKKFTKVRSSLNQVVTVSSYSVKPKVTTQRRRLKLST